MSTDCGDTCSTQSNNLYICSYTNPRPWNSSVARSIGAKEWYDALKSGEQHGDKLERRLRLDCRPSRVTNTSMAASHLADPGSMPSLNRLLSHQYSFSTRRHLIRQNYVAEDDAGRGNKSVNAGKATGPDGTPLLFLNPVTSSFLPFLPTFWICVVSYAV